MKLWNRDTRYFAVIWHMAKFWANEAKKDVILHRSLSLSGVHDVVAHRQEYEAQLEDLQSYDVVTVEKWSVRGLRVHLPALLCLVLITLMMAQERGLQELRVRWIGPLLQRNYRVGVAYCRASGSLMLVRQSLDYRDCGSLKTPKSLTAQQLQPPPSEPLQ